MVLSIIKVWKTSALARDPSANIATVMNSAETNKETQTKAKKKLLKKSNEPKNLEETMVLKQKVKPEPNNF